MVCVCIFMTGAPEVSTESSFFMVSQNRTCDPWFTRPRLIPYTTKICMEKKHKTNTQILNQTDGTGYYLGKPRNALFVCLFCCFTSQVNIYGHCGMVSSPNHTFSWASLNKQLTSTSCTTDNNPSEGRKMTVEIIS